jgi:hypothetical protein
MLNDKKIEVVVDGRKHFGTYSCAKGMMSVNSEYGTKATHGCSEELAKNILREMVPRS